MTDVIKMSDYKKKKDLEEDFAKGRQPLFINSGKATGVKSEDFGDRYQRVKKSLEKINRLMAELKTMSDKKEDNGK